jgi:hypothetical protein
MQLANQEAQRFNHKSIGTAHILLGLLKEGSGIAACVLKGLKLNLDNLRTAAEGSRRKSDYVIMGRLPLAAHAKNAIQAAMREAHNLGHDYVGTEHILLGIISEKEGTAYWVLADLGITDDAVRKEVFHLLGCGETPDIFKFVIPPGDEVPSLRKLIDKLSQADSLEKGLATLKQQLNDIAYGICQNQYKLHDLTRILYKLGGKAPDPHPECMPWPTDWPAFYHSNEACDMLVGPCACGAWHLKGEFFLQYASDGTIWVERDPTTAKH